MTYREIGRKIQKAREEAGLSQEELAARLGCTQAALSNYELGKRRLYLSQLERISEVLGKPITYFLETRENERDKPAHLLEDPLLLAILRGAAELSEEGRRCVLAFIEFKRGYGR